MAQFYLRLPILKWRFKPEATCERLATFSDHLKGTQLNFQKHFVKIKLLSVFIFTFNENIQVWEISKRIHQLRNEKSR